MSLVSVNENLAAFPSPQHGHHRSDALPPVEQPNHLNDGPGLGRHVPVPVLRVVTVGAGADLAAPEQSSGAAVATVRPSPVSQLSPRAPGLEVTEQLHSPVFLQVLKEHLHLSDHVKPVLQDFPVQVILGQKMGVYAEVSQFVEEAKISFSITLFIVNAISM